MLVGRRYWIWIWFGILALGVFGLAGAIHWGLQTKWRNLEEVLRGVGTICVSVGMLLLLYHTGGGAGQTLLLAALIAFILAFTVGRDRKPTRDAAGRPHSMTLRFRATLAAAARRGGGARCLLAAQVGGAGTGGAARLLQERRLEGNWRRVLMIGAHPDDEDTELLTILARGQGIETAYLSLTRGDGGQNLIGPELGEALGVLRTEELAAARAHRWRPAVLHPGLRLRLLQDRRRRRSASGSGTRFSRTWCGSSGGSGRR